MEYSSEESVVEIQRLLSQLNGGGRDSAGDGLHSVFSHREEKRGKQEEVHHCQVSASVVKKLKEHECSRCCCSLAL